MYAYLYYFIIESLKTNLKCEWSYSYLFSHFSSHPSDAVKSGISNFWAKKIPFSWIIDPSIGVFWILCKTDHSNRVLPTFSHWQPRNFLVIGGLSSSGWVFFSLFLIQVKMVFLDTPNFLYVTECNTFPSKFSYSAYFRQTLLFWRQWEQKTDLFFIYDRNFCFDSSSNLFGNSKMKLEYVNVRDRKKKWFKGPKNLFNIGKSSRKVRNRERLCSVLEGNFKEPNILFEIERYPR